MFWIVFGILIGTGAFYLIFADGEVQHWNNPKKLTDGSKDNEKDEEYHRSKNVGTTNL